MTHNTFRPPRTVRQYGFDANHRAIEQAASPSGFLLPWEALDAEAVAIATRMPCQFLVVGETVRDDGIRYPELGVNPAWMRDQGYVRIPKGGWHVPSEECDRARHARHEHELEPTLAR